MRSLRLLSILLIFTSLGYGANFQSQLDQLSKEHHGKISFFAKNLKTGDTVAIDPDTPVQTASVIKLPILLEAFHQIHGGQRALQTKIVLRKEDQVFGSGILQFLSTPHELTFQDVLTLMVIVSDNTATNLAIDQVGLKSVNDRIAALGLKNTHLYKKVYKPSDAPMPPDQKKFGLGKTTAREMAKVMESIVNCDVGSRELCDQMLDIMRNQQDRNMIPRYLETTDTSEQKSQIADKIGALDKVRNDVAVVFTKAGPIVISAFTYDNRDESWTPENEAEILIGRMAKVVVEGWSPGGLAPSNTAAK